MINELEILRVLPFGDSTTIEWIWRHYPSSEEIIDSMFDEDIKEAERWYEER